MSLVITFPFRYSTMGHIGQASVGVSNNLLYLKFLEASQSAFESSEKALIAAEEAHNAAKIVHVEAKAALDAATEAFKAASYKTSESEKTSTPWILSEQGNADSDEDETDEDFIMLSTKKDPVIDLEDDMYPTFFLITSSGPAADHQGAMLGLYRRTELMTEGRSVYMQEQDTQYGASPGKLFSDKGVWMITFGGVFLRAATPSESPASVKWQQYHEYNRTVIWCDDPNLTVTGLSEKPSECEVTIRLSQDTIRDVDEPWVAGVYRAEGSYRLGRPVLQRLGGHFTLSVHGSCWRVKSDVGGALYLGSGSAPSHCPADPRAARSLMRGQTHWRYKNKNGGKTESSGISVQCNKCNN